MRKTPAITRLFLDIGGALLTDACISSCFLQIAQGLGIRRILHTDCRSTCAKLPSFGLQNDDGVIHEIG